MIELKNVTKKYNQVTAVNNISLRIKEKEIFGIIGTSGAGKSTLIRLINQLESQDSGEVLFNNNKLTKTNLRESRKKIGMIFQHFNLLWSRTVIENIELPLELTKLNKQERRQRAKELIELVGLSGKEDSYPSKLSGGQKQRVGIARALANNPSVLLCDEATSALDPDTTNAVLELLDKINKELGVTIVLITHQMDVVSKICHNVAVMEHGVIVEQGTVEDIFRYPKQDVTKRFVESLNNSGEAVNSNTLKSLYPTGDIIRLTFTNETSNKPVLANAIRKYNTTINIINSNLNHSQTGVLGVMYIHIDDNKSISNLQEYLINQGVGVEII